MASSSHLFQDDQTDEDFFDKLVDDDDFGFPASSSVVASAPVAHSSKGVPEASSSEGVSDRNSSEIVPEVNSSEGMPGAKLIMSMSGSKPNMNLAGKGELSVADRSFETFEADDDVEGPVVGTDVSKLEEKIVPEDRSASIVPQAFTFEQVVPCDDRSVETKAEIVLPDLSLEKSTLSRGTSVKEVQWSVFSGSGDQSDLGGFGSYSDFFPEGSSEPSVVSEISDSKSVTEATAPNNMGTYFGSSEQLVNQAWNVAGEQAVYGSSSEQQHGQASSDANSPQYWESLYPGWKYDYNTGQWYQVEGTDASSNAHLEDYGTTVANTVESSESSTQVANSEEQVEKEVVPEQNSDVLYMQQTSVSEVSSVADSAHMGSVSNWNMASQGNTGYPENMVFDPQYPGWYYDTITQQWLTLESYTQSTQAVTNTTQNQLSVENYTKDEYFSGQNNDLYNNNVNQVGDQTLLHQASQELVLQEPQHNLWQPNTSNAYDFSGKNQQVPEFYGSVNQVGEVVANQGHENISGGASLQGFNPAESLYSFNQPRVEQRQQVDMSQSYYSNPNVSVMNSQQLFETGISSQSAFINAPTEGRSSAGRPLHALVTFGFGGKLVITKCTSSAQSFASGNQGTVGCTISILNLVDAVKEKSGSNSTGFEDDVYFHSLCNQSFPGPLVGGSASTKDLNKWIDERIALCKSTSSDFRRGELLKLLLSLLKISNQYYGKLRSPFGTDLSSLENDCPELAVTKLFSSSKRTGTHFGDHGAITCCMHALPTEGQSQATAAEVQGLLVSGKRKEALQCAQEGALWGPALVLAGQLGEKFYVDTVRQMANRQFVPGSPLRTLCLLIAGQPADVFDGSLSQSLGGGGSVAEQAGQVSANGMLDDWEENLAVISANRTKDDERVLIHLGDCLWKDRGETIAAHTCYLVAESNFESYSGSARLCLIGADHLSYPRTYASPDAIQRTEFYEHSKVLGNSQFQLLTFQPYKLIYAHMLAEVGKVPDALRYSQAILKLLKHSNRTPEVEMWKLEASSLEERLRTHQQGGYGTNLAPAKLVGKLITSIDKSIHRMIGAPPPSLPPLPDSKMQTNEYDLSAAPPKFATSQSTMAMSSLTQSASGETLNKWTGDGFKNMHGRSISEPDFGRNPQAEANPSSSVSSPDQKSKPLKSGGSSRFSLFGSGLLQRTVGWVSRSRQAKLGDQNKFYFDKKLNRWVEEGAEPTAEEATPPPPPKMASFQNELSNSAFNTTTTSVNGEVEPKLPNPTSQHSPGIPPLPPSQNQFSARGRLGVRARYVDTFNKGGGGGGTSFQTPSAQSFKPMGGPKFFVPAPIPSSETSGEETGGGSESIQEVSSQEDVSSVVAFSSTSSLPSTLSSHSMQRFPSMDNISSLKNKDANMGMQNGNGLAPPRAASWSGGITNAQNQKMSGSNKHQLSKLGTSSAVSMSNDNSSRDQLGGSPLVNGGRFGDDLHDVEL